MANLKLIEIEQATFKTFDSVCSANFRSHALQIAYMINELYPSKEVAPVSSEPSKVEHVEPTVLEKTKGSLTLERKNSFTYSVMTVAASIAKENTAITAIRIYRRKPGCLFGSVVNALANLKGSGFLTKVPKSYPAVYEITEAGLAALNVDSILETEALNLFDLNL